MGVLLRLPGPGQHYTLFFAVQIVAFWFLPSITSIVMFQVVLYMILTFYGGGFATLPAYIGDLFGTKELGAIHGYVLSLLAMAGVWAADRRSAVPGHRILRDGAAPSSRGAFVVALAVSIMMTIYVINARNGRGTVTIFGFNGQDFIRVQITLLTSEGKSAVNTTLDREHPSYQALMQKRSYVGEATIFGRNYQTHHAPLTTEAGELNGAIFVGNQK